MAPIIVFQYTLKFIQYYYKIPSSYFQYTLFNVWFFSIPDNYKFLQCMIFQYTPGFHHPIFLYTIVVQYTVMRHSVYQSFQYTIMRHFSIPKSEIFSIPCAIFQYTKVWDFQYTVRHFSKPKSEIFSNTTLYYPIFQYTGIRHFSTPNMIR